MIPPSLQSQEPGTKPPSSGHLLSSIRGKQSVGLGKIGFNVHRHDFVGENVRDPKEVFEGIVPVGAAVTLSLQWGDSDFVTVAPILCKIARQAGLTTLVSLAISSGTFLLLPSILVVCCWKFCPFPFAENKSGIQEIQVPQSLQSSFQGKASFSQKPLSDNFVQTVCLIAQRLDLFSFS